MKLVRLKAVVAGGFLAASAGVWGLPVVFSGFDFENSNQPRPLSNAAAGAFDAAANESIITFESAPIGGFATLIVAPGVTLGSNQSMRNTPAGSPDRLFGYNTTAAGANFVSLNGGSVTFTFGTPIEALGFMCQGNS